MTITLTCPIGKFTFEEDVPLSLMKLVRDTVWGQMVNPKQRCMTVETVEDAEALIRASESQVLASIQFDLELKAEWDTVGDTALTDA